MMVNPSSLEADPAEGRVRAPRQQGSKSSVRSKEQARKGHAARKLKRALNAKNLTRRSLLHRSTVLLLYLHYSKHLTRKTSNPYISLKSMH